MKFKRNPILLFFVLVFAMLFSSCGLRNDFLFVGEDAHFANYGILGTDSAGLTYYQDSDDPTNIAVGVGSCVDENIIVNTYNGSPVTEVYPGGFQNCKTIKTISLPNTVNKFGTEAFAGSTLTSITIPNSLEVISTGAFRNCQNLESVYFESGTQVRAINDYAFANDFKLSYFPFNKLNELLSIGKEAFLYCIALKSVVFPDKFLTLSEYAFHDCTGLTTIYFPASITTISEYAFRGVGSNATIYFAEDQATAFGDCGISYNPEDPVYQGLINYMYNGSYIPIIFGVGNLIIDGPFKYIHPDSGKYNLMKCQGGIEETAFTITDDIEFIEDIADDEVILMEYDDDGRTGLVIPDTVEWGETMKVVGIYPSIFMDNLNITSVTFGPNLRFIDYQAFSKCTNLKTIDLRSAVSLKYIQGRAFYKTCPQDLTSDWNTRITKIHIPSSVINIAEEAFRDCKNLDKLFFDGATERIVETQIYMSSYNKTRTFTLEYYPSLLEEVSVAGLGPITNYTINGQTIVIANKPFASDSTYTLVNQTLINFTYRTNATSKETLVGKSGVSSYTLRNLAVQVGRVTINGTECSNYTTNTVDEKTVVTIATSINDGDAIEISYRSEGKLNRIADFAFYDGNQREDFSNRFDKHQEVYFPGSLTEIGSYAFAGLSTSNGTKSCIFMGGVHFSSNNLVIKQFAFFNHKSINEIEFLESADSLVLYEKCFGASSAMYAGGYWAKPLTKVVLPENTRVEGNDIFHYHFRLKIYCLGGVPQNVSSYPEWNRMYSNSRTGTSLDQNPLNQLANTGKSQYFGHGYFPVHVVDSINDIVSLPNATDPILTFVKPKGTSKAVLTGFEAYGPYATDPNGFTAINPKRINDSTSTTVVSYNNNLANSRFNSDYLSLMNFSTSNTSNIHYELKVPSRVSFDSGSSFLNVTEIGEQALAFQCHTSTFKPNSSADYWSESKNFWTVKKIYLPNSIEKIADKAFAICPIKDIYSYDVVNSSLSNDIKSYLPTGICSENGYFPSSLTYLGKASFIYGDLREVHLPAALTTFGGVTASSAASSILVHEFPFQGCFDLETLDFYNTASVSNQVFTSTGTVVSYTDPTSSASQMIEAVNGASSIQIPWGTTTVSQGAMRGCRKVTSVTFPYTMTSVPYLFIDAIENVYSNNNAVKGDNALESVNFGGPSDYGVSSSTKKSLCTTFESYSFNNCKKLKNVEIPNLLKTFKTASFNNCLLLDNFTVDQGDGNAPIVLGTDLDFTKTPLVQTIESSVFQHCEKITSVTTNNRIGTLNNSAFRYNYALEEVTLDAALTYVNDTCFANCTALTTVTVNAAAGKTVYFKKQAFLYDALLENVTFTNNCIIDFREECMNGCIGLKSLNIPDKSTIQKKAFKDCTGFAYSAGSQNGIVLGAGCKFLYSGAESAFIGCDPSTRIYIKENASTYLSARTDGGGTVRYPNGWNYYSTTSAINTYIYAETESEKTEPTLKYWHYVGGVPTAW